MTKKGATELPMSAVIIGIVAIIVLLLIVTFFTGGLGTIGAKLRDIFSQSTAGYELSTVTGFCREYCEAAKMLEPEQQKNSAYCKKTFNIKQVDGSLLNPQNCWDVNVICPEIECT